MPETEGEKTLKRIEESVSDFKKAVESGKAIPPGAERERNRTYRLTLTEHQAQVLTEALDLYVHLSIGQIYLALDPVEFTLLKDCPVEDVIALREALRGLQRQITGSRSGGPGIHNTQVSDKARVAFDLEQVVRHRLAWDTDPNPRFKGVNYNTPMQTSTEEGLAGIERAEE